MDEAASGRPPPPPSQSEEGGQASGATGVGHEPGLWLPWARKRKAVAQRPNPWHAGSEGQGSVQRVVAFLGPGIGPQVSGKPKQHRPGLAARPRGDSAGSFFPPSLRNLQLGRVSQ